eukprot:1070087-Lingulodinium_polyedra.AAC.1
MQHMSGWALPGTPRTPKTLATTWGTSVILRTLNDRRVCNVRIDWDARTIGGARHTLYYKRSVTLRAIA